MPRHIHRGGLAALMLCLALTSAGCALDVADPEPIEAVSSEIRRLRAANYRPTRTMNDTMSAQSAGTMSATCTSPPPPAVRDFGTINYDLTLTSRIIDQLLAVDDAGGANTFRFTTQSGVSLVGAGSGDKFVSLQVLIDGADVWNDAEQENYPPTGTTRQTYRVDITRDMIDTMVPGGVLQLAARGTVFADAGGCARINQSIVTWYFDGQPPVITSRP